MQDSGSSPMRQATLPADSRRRIRARLVAAAGATHAGGASRRVRDRHRPGRRAATDRQPCRGKASKAARTPTRSARRNRCAVPPPIPTPPATPIRPQRRTPTRRMPPIRTQTRSHADGTATGGHHGIVVDKGGKRVASGVCGRDREYDSFEQFVQDAPWLAGLVFLVVLLVFLVPLLIIVLLIWYKMRKNRDGQRDDAEARRTRRRAAGDGNGCGCARATP